jgi:hypothetical protein
VEVVTVYESNKGLRHLYFSHLYFSPRLPRRIQEQARRANRTSKTDPSHRGLEFKKLPPHPDI